MKERSEIVDWILENCIDCNDVVNLSNLDFGDKEIRLDGIKGKIIYNSFQESNEIYNSFQTAKKNISNRSQKSKIISNLGQGAKKIYT